MCLVSLETKEEFKELMERKEATACWELLGWWQRPSDSVGYLICKHLKQHTRMNDGGSSFPSSSSSLNNNKT